ncbi:UNVERIFIED_CONTAM: hypothetical protein GTU68_045182 [Idotea baltica]|nr:hypothetical protein [Idotea baltica]
MRVAVGQASPKRSMPVPSPRSATSVMAWSGSKRSVPVVVLTWGTCSQMGQPKPGCATA